MTSTVHFSDDPFDPDGWEKVETDDVLAAIFYHYQGNWPETARLYYDTVSEQNDITPKCEAEVDRIRDELSGRFFVIVYPDSPLVILGAALVAVLAAATLFLGVNQPSIATTRATSANNELNRRVNQARPNARIPDIFGTVRSTPDLIAQPYRVFDDNIEVELTYMCVGRGSYDISDILDGETRASDIDGTSIEVFGPNTSPNSGDAPQLRIGTAISEPVKTAFESNAVNGQELLAPNSGSLTASSVTASPTNNLQMNDLSAADVTERFPVGSTFTLSSFDFTYTIDVDGTPQTFLGDLNGTYTVQSISGTTVRVVNPASVNADWNNLVHAQGGQATDTSANVAVSSNFWVGPFDIQGNNNVELVVNFVARNGLYIRANRQIAVNVTVELEYTLLDADRNPIGSAITQQTTLIGSTTTQATRAQTLRVQTTHDGPIRVRARRITDTNLTSSGTVVDEVRFQELYALDEITQTNFGDVTTVHSRVAATPGALAVKERKLNMLATRRIPVRNADGSFGNPTGSTNAADIIHAITLDPLIGRRAVADMDVQQIYDTVAAIETYFGNALPARFSYTFDSLNFTYEQTIAAIAEAIFCTAYRRGRELRLQFERSTTDSVMLFNHRNKTPGSERRTYTFGRVENRDGVELEYVDPSTDTREIILVPSDGTARNPQKISTIGVRSEAQAHLHAMRAFNRINHQVVSAEFTTTGEGLLLVQGERILNTDNTRPESQGGEVIGQTGLMLNLSQPVDFGTNTTLPIHIQLSDKTVEVFTASPVTGNEFAVTIDRAPRVALVTGANRYARSTYALVSPGNGSTEAFIVDTMSPSNRGFEARVVAINYDARYYANDQDRRVP